MTASTLSGEAAVREALKAKPDGVLESLAEAHGVSYRSVVDCLAPEQRRMAPAARFDAIWSELTEWGPVMFIVHTRNGVFETKAPLPPGTHGRGYFNFHGDSPIGGHLNVGRCAGVYFVDRPFFGRRSCSIQFIDSDGEAMFKVFVARDANRELDPAQLGKFEALRNRLAG
jgi:putative heme utilization carrier protein HutX